MNDKKIKTPEDLQAWLDEMRAEIQRVKEEADQTAWEVYENARESFYGAQGTRRIQDLAEEHNITFNEALTRWGNALHPVPPGLEGHKAGTVVSMSEEEREEQAELKLTLAGRDLSGLSAEQRESMSLEEVEFFTRPRNDTEA